MKLTIAVGHAASFPALITACSFVFICYLSRPLECDLPKQRPFLGTTASTVPVTQKAQVELAERGYQLPPGLHV